MTKAKLESDVIIENTHMAIENLKRFQTDVLLPIEQELDIITNMCTYILGGPKYFENYVNTAPK